MLIRKPRNGLVRSPRRRSASRGGVRDGITSAAAGSAATASMCLAFVMVLRAEDRVPLTGSLGVQLLVVAAMAAVVLRSTLDLTEDRCGRRRTVGLLTVSAGSVAAALAPDRGGLLIAALVITIGTAAVAGTGHQLVAGLWGHVLALATVVLAVTAAATVGHGPVLLGSGTACAIAAVIAHRSPTSPALPQHGQQAWSRRTLGRFAGGWLCCAGLHTACAHLLGTGPTLAVAGWAVGTWSITAVALMLALRCAGPYFVASAGALACLALGVGVLLEAVISAASLTVSAVLIGAGLCAVAACIPPARRWREDELPSRRPPSHMEPIVPWPLR